MTGVGPRRDLGPLPPPPPDRRHRGVRLLAPLGALLVLAAATGLWTRAGTTGGLRTTIAQLQDVTQTMDVAGTIEPVSRATVAFPVAGTVADVQVAVGDTVTNGQTLATLDSTSLQHQVDAAQAKLDQARLNLDKASTGATSTAGASSSAAPSSPARQAAPATVAADTGSSTLSSAKNESGGNANTGASASPPSAADLAADQKAVDAASAALTVAQQAMAQGTIASPIDGSVVAVTMAAGDTVTADSSTARITIVGTGGMEATALVGVDKVPQVKVGQSATVTPDGAARPVAGRVVAVGAPTSSSTGATTYPVVVSLQDGIDAGNGTIATVTITTGAATSVLAVPTSAVHRQGTRTSVTVLEGGRTRDVDVQVGATGPAWAEITSGLSPGAAVIVADLGQALPGSVTSTGNATTVDRTLGM